jgi:hypothetical protein
MTTQQALTAARRRFGKTAAVKRTPQGAFVGAHGEFVDAINVRPKDSQYARAGHYYCHTCSDGDARVYHQPGAPQMAYAVGTIGLGIFFVVEGEGDSWAAAFAQADAKRQRERDEYAALRAGRR